LKDEYGDLQIKYNQISNDKASLEDRLKDLKKSRDAEITALKKSNTAQVKALKDSNKMCGEMIEQLKESLKEARSINSEREEILVCRTKSDIQVDTHMRKKKNEE
jgi:hypothetical protein